MQPKRLFFSLRSKFIILFCLLISIPFFISGLITYQQYSHNVEKDAITYTKQLVGQISTNLDRFMKEMDRLTVVPYYNEDVIAILKNHQSSQHTVPFISSSEAVRMNLAISSISLDRSELQGIFIFANDGSIFSNLQESVKKHWNVGSNPWMKEVDVADGSMVVLSPHLASYYVGQPKKVISVARVIRAEQTNEHLGIIKIDLDEQFFNKIFALASLEPESHIYVSDRQGRLLYPFESDIKLFSVGRKIQYQGVTYITATNESNYTGLRVTGLVSQKNLQQNAHKLIRFTLIISLSSLIIAFFVSVFAASRLVTPIRHLQMKMRNVQKGNFHERASVTTHDEIGQLTEGFNIMVKELDSLVREVYESKLREKEAEFYALQSQINPHFIYNTLESINSLALESHQHELSDVVVNLGKLLRYTVDNKEKYVYLREEVSFVEAYLQVQSSRQGVKLKTEIDIEIGHEYFIIPKLILQPLVENVIEHAMETEPITVRLSTLLKGNDLWIILEDDGKGMSKERMAYVENHMYEQEQFVSIGRFGEKKREFALRNVHKRLSLLFGEGYGLFIDKNIYRGAKFCLRVPQLNDDEEGSLYHGHSSS